MASQNNALVMPSIASLIARLWGHLNVRRRLQLGALLALMIIVSFAEAISIGTVIPFLGILTSPDWLFNHPIAKPFITRLGFTEPKELLKPLTILFAAAAIVSGGLRLFLHWTQTRLGYAIGADFSISIYRQTLYQPYAVHLSRNSSEVITGVTTKADSVVYQSLLPLFTIFSSTMMLLATLSALVALQPVVAIVSITSFGGIYALAIVLTRSRLSRDSQLINREQTLIVKALQEALGGIRDVLIDGTQQLYCRIYERADRRLRRAQANVGIVAVSPRFIVEAVGIALIAAMAYVLAVSPQGLGSTIPMMGMLALGAQRMLPVLQQAYSSWTIIRSGQVALRDALELMDQSLPAHAAKPSPSPLAFQRDIGFDALSFRYYPTRPWVLQGLTLRIPKGDRVGFIGTTGSGKSTLLDIVMGLLIPTEGSLHIDGVEITSSNCRAWQAHIAHVPQSIYLADTTVAENIAFGVPTAQIDYGRIQRAARRAQIADSIESWEHGYETLVGERGVRLSGGQRQRIGIARALYKEVDVIVFDEATSALDSETERAVMSAINSLGNDITILMVAHRLSTLRDCTQVVELQDGMLKRIGTYQEIVGTTT
jgi:ATP-binding cassette subfamily B protein